MNLNEIIDRFTLVSGLDMRGVSRYLPVIADCKSYIEERLTGGLDTAQQRRAAHACAVYAYYKLCMTIPEHEFNYLKAGELQLSSRSSADIRTAAEHMWEEERRAVSDIADFDSDFGFRSVRI